MSRTISRHYPIAAVGAAVIHLASLACAGAPAGRDPSPLTAAARGPVVIEAALAALGGRERIAAVGTWDVAGTGRENLDAEAQGVAPGVPTWREHEERLAVDARTLTVAWQRRTPRNDQSLRWRRLIYGPEETGFADLAAGRGMMRPAPTAESDRQALARRVPHLLLLEAAAEPTRLAHLGERTVGGRVHDLVAMTTSAGEELVLVLAREPGVLRRVEYRAHLPTRGDVTVTWEWHGWRPDPLLGRVPAGHRIAIGGVPFQEVSYSRFAGNAPVDDLLTVPEGQSAPGGSPAPPPPAPPAAGFPATGTVAPGVHVGQVGGFVVLAVELDDFVVAVEAPEAHPGFERIPAGRPGTVSPEHLAWLQEVAPDKPVRYLVVSHHHSDHLGGVRAFAAAGATILVAQGDVAAVRAALAAPHTLSAAQAQAPLGEVAVEGVADRRVIAAAGRRIEILQVGANPHTDENLAVWLPAEGILFQGDLFYYADGAPFPPSGRETMNRFLAGWLTERGLAPAAIYGVHNRGAAGPEALARALPGT